MKLLLKAVRSVPDAARQGDAHGRPVEKMDCDVPRHFGGEFVRFAHDYLLGVTGPVVEVGGEGGEETREKGLGRGCGVEDRSRPGRVARAEDRSDGLD